jgi:hypothetical protein
MKDFHMPLTLLVRVQKLWCACEIYSFRNARLTSKGLSARVLHHRGTMTTTDGASSGYPSIPRNDARWGKKHGRKKFERIRSEEFEQAEPFFIEPSIFNRQIVFQRSITKSRRSQ